MFYGRNSFKFVFIGAGSSVFTMRLVGDILGESSICGGELALVDIDEEVLKTAEAGVTALVRHSGKPFAVTSHNHYKKALAGADFVFFIYAVGAYAAWKKDIEICTRFGVNQSVGDTIGPGGIIRILRTIPLTVEIVREMERVCPDAYVINYANPEGAQCLAVQRYSKIKSFGLCHGTPDTAHVLAERVFGVSSDRFTYEAAGINHLTWFTRMCIDGADVCDRLDSALKESGFAEEEPISYDLFRIFGLYPAPGDRHVSEFFSAFLKDKVMYAKDYRWKNNDFRVVDSWRRDGERRLEKALATGEGLDDFLLGSGETATHFIRSLITGEITVEMVNVINCGYIRNMSDGIIVEIPTFVDSLGLHPQTVGALPAGIAAKCETLGREYSLLVDASLEGDRQKLLQAVFMDPICANCDDPEAMTDALLDEFSRYIHPNLKNIR